MGSTERPKKRAHLCKKAILHFSLCFIMGFFTGFAPTAAPKSSISSSGLSNTTKLLSPHTTSNFTRNLAAEPPPARKRDQEELGKKMAPPRRQIIIVTPTSSSDRFREVGLRRLGNTIRLVRQPLLWIVVEAKRDWSNMAEIMRKTGIMYRHLVFKENFTDSEAEMNHQRNVALKHIEHHRLSGIVHFAGLSNFYDLRFFDELREIEVFGTWPMALLTANKKRVVIEGPVCDSSQVIGWHLKKMANQTQPKPQIHISSFAFNSSILWDPERWGRTSSVQDTSQSVNFVKQVVLEDEAKLTGIPSGDCSKIMLWSLRTSTKTPPANQQLPPVRRMKTTAKLIVFQFQIPQAWLLVLRPLPLSLSRPLLRLNSPEILKRVVEVEIIDGEFRCGPSSHELHPVHASFCSCPFPNPIKEVEEAGGKSGCAETAPHGEVYQGFISSLYEFLQQKNSRNSSRSKNPLFTDPNNPTWGWSWLERWMAAQQWGEVSSSISRGEIDKADAQFDLSSMASPTVSQSESHRYTFQPLSHFSRRRSVTEPKKLKSSSRNENSVPEVEGFGLTLEANSPTASQSESQRYTFPSLSTPSPQSSVVVGTKSKQLRARNNSIPDDDYRSVASIQSNQSLRHSNGGPRSSLWDEESQTRSPILPGYMTLTESSRAKSRLQSPIEMENNKARERTSFSSSAKKHLLYPPSPARSRRYSDRLKVDYGLNEQNGRTKRDIVRNLIV